MVSRGPGGRGKGEGLAIKALVFDLDDTLLDTTAELVKGANREAARALVAAGVPGPVTRCELLRARASAAARSSDPDAEVCRLLGVTDETVIEAGRRAFYARGARLRRRGTLRLMPGARATLAQLSRERELFLITWGDPATQRIKLEMTRIEGFFCEIRLVDRRRSADKLPAIRRLFQRWRLSPRQVLVVGDRWEQELYAGWRLGAWTCRVCRGPGRGRRGWPPLTLDAEVDGPAGIPRVLRRLERRQQRLTRSRAAL